MSTGGWEQREWSPCKYRAQFSAVAYKPAISEPRVAGQDLPVALLQRRLLHHLNLRHYRRHSNIVPYGAHHYFWIQGVKMISKYHTIHSMMLDVISFQP